MNEEQLIKKTIYSNPICQSCKKEVPKGSTFCINCGNKIDQKTSSSKTKTHQKLGCLIAFILTIPWIMTLITWVAVYLTYLFFKFMFN